MQTAFLVRTLALGAITGTRSLSGATALALGRGGLAARASTVLWLGEMIADKTPYVGNRTDALPAAGRAVLGGLVGAASAREAHVRPLVGVLLGAGAALTMTYLAFHLRQRLAGSRLVGGLVEDAVVAGVTACCVSRPTRVA